MVFALAPPPTTLFVAYGPWSDDEATWLGINVLELVAQFFLLCLAGRHLRGHVAVFDCDNQQACDWANELRARLEPQALVLDRLDLRLALDEVLGLWSWLETRPKPGNAFLSYRRAFFCFGKIGAAIQPE